MIELILDEKTDFHTLSRARIAINVHGRTPSALAAMELAIKAPGHWVVVIGEQSLVTRLTGVREGFAGESLGQVCPRDMIVPRLSAQGHPLASLAVRWWRQERIGRVQIVVMLPGAITKAFVGDAVSIVAKDGAA